MNEALTLADGFSIAQAGQASWRRRRETAVNRSPKCVPWSQTHLGNPPTSSLTGCTTMNN